jgi:hypothetical protein
MAELCSRINAYLLTFVKTNQASVVEVSDLNLDLDLDLDSPTHLVEVSDLHSPAHDIELNKNLCPVTCKKPCACSNTAEEKKKSPLDLSEIKEKVEEVLQLLEDRDFESRDFESRLLEEALME